jgi:hypothetical protein
MIKRKFVYVQYRCIFPQNLREIESIDFREVESRDEEPVNTEC